MKDTRHESLIWDTVGYGERLDFFKILCRDPDVYPSVFFEGVLGVLAMTLDLAAEIFDGFPFSTFDGVKEFLLFLIEFRLLHFSLPNSAVSLCGSG